MPLFYSAVSPDPPLILFGSESATSSAAETDILCNHASAILVGESTVYSISHAHGNAIATY